MTVWVIRDGELIDKRLSRMKQERSSFPTPMLSKPLEPYQSPIDGKEITSWAVRDQDLKENNCYDPRDFSGTYPKGRKAKNERPEPEQLSLPFREHTTV